MRMLILYFALYGSSVYAAGSGMDLSKVEIERGLYTYILDGDIATTSDILPQGIIGRTIIRENRINLAMHKKKKDNPEFFPERVSYSAHGRIKIDEPGGYVFAVRAHSPPLAYNCANCGSTKKPKIVKNAYLDCSFEVTFINSKTKKSLPVLFMETSGRVGERYNVNNLKHPTIENPGCAEIDQAVINYELKEGQYQIHYHITCPGVRNFENAVEDFEAGQYIDDCGMPVPHESLDTWPGDEVVWELFLKAPGEYVPRPFIPNEHHRIKQWD